MKQFSELELGTLNRAKQAKTDLIGTIWNSAIMGLLGFDAVETLEEKEAWNNIVKHLEGDQGMSKMEASQVYDLISMENV